MSNTKENKTRIQPHIEEFLATVAREILPNGFHIDRDDLKSLMRIITVVKKTPRNSGSLAQDWELSVQADFRIRVYSRLPVKQGAAIAGGIGAGLGVVGGTAGGITAGAVIGSVVPVAGTVVGGIIGGVLGFFGGLAVGGSAGASTGAGLGAADSNNRHTIVYAHQVFAKCNPGSSNDITNNKCHCVLTIGNDD